MTTTLADVQTIAPAPVLPVAPVSLPIIDADDQHREAFRLKMAGEKPAEIAQRFGVDVSTVYRWFEKHREAYRLTLENSTSVNIIADEVARLDSLERDALKSAEQSISERAKQGHRRIALQAMKARQQLLLECGVIPKEPTKIYSVVSQMKPSELQETAGRQRTDDEIRQDLVRLLGEDTTV
ncbi:MAG: helix-turn-helix domain-containing protein [Planctomycetia bacterium]|nr:helix-turn-helix domain-containing protein [Planctomycetia bacterium]